VSSKSAVSDSSRAVRKKCILERPADTLEYLVMATEAMEAMGAAEKALLSAEARAALPAGKARPFVAQEP